ncbi:MAG: FG-GAP repeat domain-containing protein [Thermoplasmatota archaeon]
MTPSTSDLRVRSTSARFAIAVFLLFLVPELAGCIGGQPTTSTPPLTSTPTTTSSTPPVTTTPVVTGHWPAFTGAPFDELPGQLAGDAAGNKAAVAYDFDGDGRIDLFVAGATANHLYMNNGDGTFTDIAATAGLACAGCHSVGASVGDFDNDGLPDLLVRNADSGVRLYQNHAARAWTDVTATSGLAGASASGGSAWFDAGNDAKLDLLTFDGKTAPAVWLNDGAGHFTRGGSGLDAAAGANAGALFFLDDDGNLDLAAANAQGVHIFQYVNGTLGNFTDVTASAKIPAATAVRTISPGDADNDQSVDLLLASPAGLTLLRNNRRKAFVDLTVSAGLAGAGAMKAATFVDVDNDGWSDIVAVADDGHVVYYHSLGKVNGVLKFEKKDAGSLTAASGVLGIALGDFDRDGRVDVYVAGATSALELDRASTLHWFVVQLKGNESASQGIGSKVTLSSGDFLSYRQAGGDASNGIGPDPEITIGLGTSTADSYTLAIKWPSGILQFQSVNATRVVDHVLAAKESAVSAPWGNC